MIGICSNYWLQSAALMKADVHPTVKPWYSDSAVFEGRSRSRREAAAEYLAARKAREPSRQLNLLEI
jgi:hypothetical protein